MELQFQVNKMPCLQQLKGGIQTQEQTQEFRLSDGMPDVGRVLSAWGQLIVRGKEWHGDSVGVSCGVMVTILYTPEDGSQTQCVETWIPVSTKWDIPDSGQDGRIVCSGGVKSVDARILSGRKMMVRATVCMTMQTYISAETEFYQPPQLPEDIQLRTKIYPVCMPQETGEKAFMLDEELTLPGSVPVPEKLVRCSLQPEITDQKVLGDKAVFRGNGLLHILYRTAEGALASWDFEIPFSQYTELEREYAHQAQVQILPFVTALETELADGGKVRLKAGLSGQYVVYDTREISVVEDAYSPDRAVIVHQTSAELPAVLERQCQPVRVEQRALFGSSRVADIAFYPGCPRGQRRVEEMSIELPGVFEVLYYDTDGVLQSGTVHYQQDMLLQAAENTELFMWFEPKGKPQAVTGEESTALQAEILLHTLTVATEALPMVTGLTVGEQAEKDPARPSLILRRAGHEDLWTIAKKTGSTVSAIQKANDLQDEPDPDRMLLIPIL